MTKQQNLFFFLIKSEGEHPDAVPKKKNKVPLGVNTFVDVMTLLQ